MSQTTRLCRLCLRSEELVNVFDKRFDNGYHLRLCIFLCSGVEIRMTDKIPKVICHNCCSLSIQLYKFRQIALANDKTLKGLVNPEYEVSDQNELQELHNSISEKISTGKLSEAAAVFLEREDFTKNVSYKYSKTNISNKKGQQYEDPDSDDENESIATLKRKYRAARALNAKESERPPYYFSDSDSDSEPISKRAKRNKYYIDEDYNGGDSDNDSVYRKSKQKLESEENRKERLRPQRGKQQRQLTPEPTPEVTPEVTPDKPIEKQGSEQKYVSEPYSKYCEYCDRYFWGNSQLKAHQRVHFRCQFCIKGFESHEILQEHLINVCYKTITRTKPWIPLARVDENIKVLHTYKTAFDKYFEDIANGMYGDPELIKNPSVKFHLYHTEGHRIAEKKDIKKIFVKLQHLDNTPVHKNVGLQTRRLQTDVVYANSNQIILDDARKDLKLFNIPIYLVIDRIQSAYISFVKPPTIEKTINLWSAGEIKDVSDKSKIGNFYPDEILPEQKKIQNKNVMNTQKLPMMSAPRKPLNNLTKKPYFEPRTKQLMPRNMMSNIRMNNYGQVGDVPRPGQNMIRKPLKVTGTSVKSVKPTGKVLYRSPNPNVTMGHMKNNPNNIERFNHYKTLNVNVPNIKNIQSNIQDFTQSKNSNVNTQNSSIIQNCTEFPAKNIDNAAPYSKILKTISNEISLQRTTSPKTANIISNLNTTLNESNLNDQVGGIIKHASGSVTIQFSKQNPKQQSMSNELASPSQNILNISNSVTLEKNQQKQNNVPVQNNLNVSYPPRPNTAIRNMLENISSEISIEPNYQRQNLNTSNISNRTNNMNNAINTSNMNNTNNANIPNTMNNVTFATPTSEAYKPNRITYPRPILIKEEFPKEDDGYNNQNILEPTLYNMDYSIKEEHEPETQQSYVKPELTDDNSYTNLYTDPPQVNFNAGYPQEPSLRYNHNQQQQYYRPLGRGTNLPAVRQRFAVAQPYRNMEYRPNNPLNIYQTRLNQPISNMPASTIPSNALVPTNSYNSNNFIPNNVYNRPYGVNYNNYNNMYQPSSSYQNQYPASYNAQPQPTMEYNNTYSESTGQEAESKFLRIKQPWELYR